MSKLLFCVFTLSVANVGALFWPDKSNVAPHVSVATSELNPHFVRLNKEIENEFYSQAKSEVVIELPEIEEMLLPEIEKMLLPESDSELTQISAADLAVLSESAAGVCYRLGPFMHQASYDLAQAVLFNAEVVYTKSKRASQESNVYRLFLGPFQERADVLAARAELKRKDVLDHFIRKQEDGSSIISLGIYSSKGSADAAVRLFEGSLDGVKTRNETVVLPDNYWLHFVLPKGSLKSSQLSEMEWGENSVKMGPYACRT